ncbi:MAG: uroporphyrinogen decarboxylase [Marivibrio sp.]|uniref:uroporphyrinogen decarboxylase n=1 Tax=Marivibrio sp. TaxID=2039719 RepID=UPI0032ED75BD
MASADQTIRTPSEMAPGDKKFLHALKGGLQKTPPIWLMRQAGRYLPEYREVRATCDGFLDLCFTPEKACEVTLQPIRRYGFDAAILFSDILVIPWALDQGVRFVEGEGPKLDALTSEQDLAALSDPTKAGEKLAAVCETVSKLSASLPKETALIGFAGAPWTVATYMIEGGSSRDFTKVKHWAFAQPESFGRLIDMIVEATVSYLSAQIEAGAEAIQLFDSWAGALDAASFDRWVSAPNRAVAERLRAHHPTIPIIGFPRAAGMNLYSYIETAGVDAVSLDQMAPLELIRHTVQPKLPVQGNLDPLALLTGGAALDGAIDKIMENLSGGPFVFNLGHGVIKETPPEHVTRLVERVRGF